MPKEDTEFFSDYSGENTKGTGSSTTFIDSDREYPVETRCCITGEAVKHGFCRYPDPSLGTMMVMSRESMIKFSRQGRSLSEKFEQVLDLRRKQENRKKSS